MVSIVTHASHLQQQQKFCSRAAGIHVCLQNTFTLASGVNAEPALVATLILQENSFLTDWLT